MKTLVALILLAAFAFISTGCSTPAYSTKERWRMIGRNARYEWQQAQDDIDHHVFLARPASGLTIWDVQ